MAEIHEHKDFWMCEVIPDFVLSKTPSPKLIGYIHDRAYGGQESGSFAGAAHWEIPYSYHIADVDSNLVERL